MGAFMGNDWREFLPAYLPLERGVPVVYWPANGAQADAGVVTDCDDETGAVYVVWDSAPEEVVCVTLGDALEALRVDLAQSLGFAHVMRWYFQERHDGRAGDKDDTKVWAAIAMRWFQGATTTLDISALARAASQARKEQQRTPPSLGGRV